MIIYSIFRNDKLIWARNFITRNNDEAKLMIENTIKDIQKEKNVKNINFDGKKLEFNSYDEKHIMMIKGE